ncbi:8393_t:CDS:2, partial [Acaulospora morrowiae]
SCEWALSWVNNLEAKELFNFLNPFLKLPDRRTFGDRILKQTIAKFDKTMEIALKDDSVGVTLCFDGWTNVQKEQLLGTIIKTSDRKPYIWKAVDIGTEQETYVEVIAKTENMLNELKTKNITVYVIVTDSAATYAAACILKTQKALQILAVKYEPPLLESHHKPGNNLTLLREIFEIIMSDIFWDQLVHIVEILEPYCKLLNILQCDKARLFPVVHSLSYLVQFWQKSLYSVLATQLITRLERRWEGWEQPILLLSCLLHPEYRMKKFSNICSKINYLEFGKWLIYYYRAWSGKEPTCILCEFDDFRLEKYPFDYDTYKQFNGDVWRYWGYVNVSTNELGFVACRIFGICVNAASVEWLWSCMGFLQNNRRNRLMSSKILEMSQLSSDIIYNYRLYFNSSMVTITSDESSSTTILDKNIKSFNTNDQNNDFDNSNNADAEEMNNVEEEDLDYKADSEIINEDSGGETELQTGFLKNNFHEYLQGWANMLEKERQETFEEG